MFGCRGVAQPGRALGLGPRCRVFESRRPDHKQKKPPFLVAFLFVLGRWFERGKACSATSERQTRVCRSAISR